jgi:hypothetical protein
MMDPPTHLWLASRLYALPETGDYTLKRSRGRVTRYSPLTVDAHASPATHPSPSTPTFTGSR